MNLQPLAAQDLAVHEDVADLLVVDRRVSPRVPDEASQRDAAATSATPAFTPSRQSVRKRTMKTATIAQQGPRADDNRRHRLLRQSPRRLEVLAFHDAGTTPPGAAPFPELFGPGRDGLLLARLEAAEVRENLRVLRVPGRDT